jgi:hypothetical protein
VPEQMRRRVRLAGWSRGRRSAQTSCHAGQQLQPVLFVTYTHTKLTRKPQNARTQQQDSARLHRPAVTPPPTLTQGQEVKNTKDTRTQGPAVSVFCDTDDPKPPKPRPPPTTPPLPDERRAPRRVLRPNRPAPAAFALP